MTSLIKEQVVKKVIQHISKNGRSVIKIPELDRQIWEKETICAYNNGKGNVCAFALFFHDDVSSEEIERDYSGESAGNLLDKFESINEPLLKEEVQHLGHDDDFWDDIQTLHDHEGNWRQEWGLGWSVSHLTEEGLANVENLIF